MQQAFIDEAAIQCGFCTPGVIMSATEIVEKEPNHQEMNFAGFYRDIYVVVQVIKILLMQWKNLCKHGL